MDDENLWRQANVTFNHWAEAEATAQAHLLPLLVATENDRAIEGWFFIRKHPCWRVRYLPALGTNAQNQIEHRLDQLASQQHIKGWSRVVYEPEAHTFGGPCGMHVAHRLFHHDSHGLLNHLRYDRTGNGHRPEMAVLLCSILMRAAGQDWYEQGDIWARVAAHREPSEPQPDAPAVFTASLRRLMTVETEHQMDAGHETPLAHAASWAAAYRTAGRELADLAAAGKLRRGLRAILAHHVIFAWNRLGLSYPIQSRLAYTARTLVFGRDPTRDLQEEVPCLTERTNGPIPTA